MGRIATAAAIIALISSPAFAARGSTLLAFTPPGINMAPGQSYAVSVTMLNSGNTYWIPGTTKLGSQNPDNNLTWGLGRVDLAYAVAPGQSYTFDFSVTAPAAAGAYSWQWRMLDENIEWFGQSTPSTIMGIVVQPDPPGDGSLDNLNNTSGVDVPLSGQGVANPASNYVHNAGCRAFGRGAVGANAGYETLRMRLYMNGSSNYFHEQLFPVPPNQPYDFTTRKDIGPSESPRSIQCIADQINSRGITKTMGASYVMAGDGPPFTEVLIKTFIPDEYVTIPPSLGFVDGMELHPLSWSAFEGDNRGFSYSSQSFRTRVWGFLNNPYNDRNVLRAAPDPFRAGLSAAYDFGSSIDQARPSGSQILPEARSDTEWGYPLKASWGYADMSRVGCTEIVPIGMQGNRVGVRIRCHHEANFPLVHFATFLTPDIDWTLNIDFWFGDTNLFTTIHSGSCTDYFPSLEIYVSGQNVVSSPASLGAAGLAGICLKSVSLTNYQVFQ